MKARRTIVALRLAAVCMILLGLARGIGGLVLLIQGTAALETIRAGEVASRGVAAGLIVVGAVELGAGVGVIMRKRAAYYLGIVATVAFALGGVINGLVLFGKPGAAGTVGNTIVAVLILVLLVYSRPAREGRSAAPRAPRAP